MPQTPRVARLRQQSLDAVPTLSTERAELMTEFYRQNLGLVSAPVRRALALPVSDGTQDHLHRRGRADRRRERARAQGHAHLPGAVLPHPGGPGHPRHPREDPLCRGRRRRGNAARGRRSSPSGRARSMRDLIFARDDATSGRPPTRPASSPSSWSSARPGHTVLDDKIYRKGFLDFKRGHPAQPGQPGLPERSRGLRQAGRAQGHGDLRRRPDPLCRAPRREGARTGRSGEPIPQRKAELERIAEVCAHVPGPRAAGLSGRRCSTTGSSTWA